MTKNPILVSLHKLLPRDSAVLGPRAFFHADVDSSMVGTAKLTIAEGESATLGINTIVDLPVRIIGGFKGKAVLKGTDSKWHEYIDPYLPNGGFAALSSALLASAVHSLPADAEVRLVVYLDADTQDYLARVDLHADRYELVGQFKRRGKLMKRSFVVGSDVIPHNSARFGSPGSAIGQWRDLA
jgi:hypothetical protein